MKRFWSIFLCMSLVLPIAAQEEELCVAGTLLFREDFGDNAPDDPAVSTMPVAGMSYQQIFVLEPGPTGMGAGKYLVTKEGYRNSTLANYSVWHIMDDHTYPGDKTRGYLMEVDGSGGTQAFYETTMSGLCPGTRLTFSTYIANLETAGQYATWKRQGRTSYLPKISFVITDPTSGVELARHNTDTIAHDWGPSTIDGGTYKKWQESAEWQLVGMNFTVPDGVSAVKLSIRNNVSQSNGNDFALDDIEVHLCAPPVTIAGEGEVCTNSPITLTANFSNDGTFAEPLAYKWWHSTDSITWTEMSGFNREILIIDAVQKADSGWYKVAVSGDGNIESVNCRTISEPFRLKVNECEPPEPPIEELCMDGILLFREDFGGNDPSDPRVRTTPVSGMSYAQVTNDVFRSMGSGKYIVTKSGYCNGDTTGWSLPGADQSTYRSQWYIQDDHTHPNDYSRGYFMEIDGSGGNQQFYQTEISGLCEGIELTFSAYVANVFTWFQYDWYTRNRGPVIAPCLKFVLTNSQTGETLVEKNTQQIPFAEELAAKTDWQYSSSWYLVGMNFIVPSGVHAIRLAIYNNVTNGNGNDFALDDIEIHLCAPPVTIVGEAEVCANTPATLTANFSNDGTFAEPLVYKWWHSTDSVTWTEISGFNGEILSFDAIQKADSGWYRVAVSVDGNIESVNCRAISEPFRLKVNECEPPEPPVPPCPEIVTERADTTVCDTLMPFTWRGMVFEEEGEKRWMEKSPRDCDSIEHVFTLRTIHCEKPEPPEPPEPPQPAVYEIIVNKYNWQLLCNNVALREYFPGQTATAFQWYKNEQAIPGATGDDYAERNELRGVFQLNVQLNDGRSIWSNIIEIEGPEDAPARVQIYNSQGMPVSEGQMTRGVYLYRYEKGERRWTEKKIVL